MAGGCGLMRADDCTFVLILLQSRSVSAWGRRATPSPSTSALPVSMARQPLDEGALARMLHQRHPMESPHVALNGQRSTPGAGGAAPPERPGTSLEESEHQQARPEAPPASGRRAGARGDAAELATDAPVPGRSRRRGRHPRRNRPLGFFGAAFLMAAGGAILLFLLPPVGVILIFLAMMSAGAGALRTIATGPEPPVSHDRKA